MEASPGPAIPVSFPCQSPTRQDFSTNDHPYPIKTTSTAILSRSNSTGHTGSKPPYYYTSASPSSPSPALGKEQGRGHRHTKSLTNPPAIPSLPLPPSPSLPVKLANGWSASGNFSDGASPSSPSRIKRSGTLPSFPTSPRTPKLLQPSDLHENPKLWTPSHLSVYLTSALRVKGGGSIPAPVARDIAAFVVTQRIGGRAFLRLTEQDLEEMGINHLWRNALLSASRSLRKNIMKGRIWGFGSEAPPSLPTSPSKRRIPSTVEEEDPRAEASNFRAGRVRSMVETLERSGSSASSDSSKDSGGDLDFTFNDEEVRRELKEAGLWDEPEVYDAGFASGELTSGSEPEEERKNKRIGLMDSLPPPYPTHAAQRSRSDETSVDYGDQSTVAGDSGVDNYASALSGDEQMSTNGLRDQEPTMEELLANEPLSTSWAMNAGTENTMRKVLELSQPPTIKRDKALPQLFVETASATAKGVPADLSVKQAAEITRNAQLLEAFRQRLEIVEKKLGEMVLRDEQRQREYEEERTRRDELQRERVRELEQDSPEVAPTQDDETQTSMVPYSITQFFSTAPKHPDHANRADGRRGNGVDDLTAAALPSYVLLVGMGVCAIVLRVLFRKFPVKRK